MIEASDFKRGLLVEIDQAPCLIEDLEVKSPSARGASTIYKIRARNLMTGLKVDKSFRSGDVVKEPDFQKRDIQFLYTDDESCHFMDQEDFNQFSLSLSQLKNEVGYLFDGIEEVQSLVFNENVIGIELPSTVELEITECDPAVRGNSATPRPKKGVLSTGKEIQVPEHIGLGEWVKVDTRTGKFLGRVSK